MTPLSVGFDWDDVVMPWHPVAVQVCRDAGLCPADVNPVSWGMHEEMGISLEAWVDAINRATISGVLYDTEPYPDALDAMRRIALAGHYVHIVTARGTFPNNPLNDHIQKITWAQIEKHAFGVTSVTFTRDKTSVPCDFFIDDNANNYEALCQAGVEAYLLTRPWNENHHAYRRVSTPGEFADIILNLETK